MHNAYSVIYNEMVFDLLRKRFGEGEAVVFARASAAGGQRWVSRNDEACPFLMIILQIPSTLGRRLRINMGSYGRSTSGGPFVDLVGIRLCIP